MITGDETAARVALCALPRLAGAECVSLLRRYGSAVEVLRDGVAALGRDRVRLLGSDRMTRRLDAALAAVDALDVRVLAVTDQAFPFPAEPIEGPPFLFVRGDLELLRRPCVAVVGTRRCTEYGVDVAEDLAAALARAGVAVISGLARGIDGAAHHAALGAGGTTVAVLGCGIDVTYPREHAALQEEIAQHGLLISEFLPNEPPRPYWFLQRNRLIAGYAAATVVVEGGATSGAINTAHHALSAHLPVFGVPGPLGRGSSDGPNALIRDGACFYSEPLDVLLAIGRAGAGGSSASRAAAAVEDAAHTGVVDGGAAETPGRAASGATGRAVRGEPDGATPHEGPLQTVLRRESRHIDDIAAQLGEPAASVLAGLLVLELDGVVEQLPGMRFRLARRAARERAAVPAALAGGQAVPAATGRPQAGNTSV